MTSRAPFYCNTCGNTPCIRPSFCRACRAADLRAAELRSIPPAKPKVTEQHPVEIVAATPVIVAEQTPAEIERHELEIYAIVGEIVRLERQLGGSVRDPGDQEAFVILDRIAASVCERA